jgi:hypothetical protein
MRLPRLAAALRGKVIKHNGIFAEIMLRSVLGDL